MWFPFGGAEWSAVAVAGKTLSELAAQSTSSERPPQPVIMAVTTSTKNPIFAFMAATILQQKLLTSSC
jgi:hypothetical protein